MTDLIDVHSHFVTDEYVAAAVEAGHVRPQGMPGWATWSTSEHLALMDQTGVRTAILSISAPGVHFGDDVAARRLARHVNEFARIVVSDHPGRFAHFASLPFPDVDGSLAELVYALDVLGSDGVAVLTNAHGVYLGDGRYEQVYAELDRRGATVFVHPVEPVNWQVVSLDRPRPMLEFIFDSARAASDLVLSGVLSRYPRINWIFSHSGGALPVLVERIQVFCDLFMDLAEPPTVAEQLGGLWYDIAGTPFPNAVPALVRAFGDQRVLYGSDYCWTPAPGTKSQVESVDAAVQPDGTTWRALTTRNAGQIFPQLG
ncbi:MAG: amidohydrolase family protein [Actinophytocola sp.]|uniref:amidohydrolase family protein n=1 Tax=Actinophytocola sp. TaxID=1872138 RepID=UPI00132CACBC|nr:amidohydrolase family protein [Actinophytocola sp.]MPZ83076.1 amidohydrolase family protein [Actinophytocola sp.]